MVPPDAVFRWLRPSVTDDARLRDIFIASMGESPFVVGHAEALEIRLDGGSGSLDSFCIYEFMAMAYKHGDQFWS